MEQALGLSSPKEGAVYESMSFTVNKTESVFTSYSRPSLIEKDESAFD